MKQAYGVCTAGQTYNESAAFCHMIFFYGTLHLFQHIPRRLSVKTLHENRPAVNENPKKAQNHSL
jgi:hypothetical protein